MEIDSSSSLAVGKELSSRLISSSPHHNQQLNSSSSDSPSRRQHYDGGNIERNVLIGLSIAGVASSVLTSVFGMFHVDVFLKAYSLPLPVYSVGSIVVTVVNTACSIAGAWIIDQIATKRSRSDMIGISGFAFAVCFLAPFLRWQQHHGFWDGMHFVGSLALYDATRSFSAILMGSVVNDNHHMSDQARVQYMASGKVANFAASFLVARIGLALFNVQQLGPFRWFLVLLAVLVTALFVLAQYMIHGRSSTRRGRWRWWWCWWEDCDHYERGGSTTHDERVGQELQWRQVAIDFWNHKNFKSWVVMEMMLEAQLTFINFFLKIFVDGLLLDAGVGRQACDWLLSMIRPLTQIAAIVAYIPIRQVGYSTVYTRLCYFNIVFAMLLLSLERSRNATSWILVFLCIYPLVTGAVQSAAYDLVQADMILEMKRKHAQQGRHDEPSLAGLFMGASALLCKPVESILPVIAANVLHHNNESKKSLFYLLIVPPVACSLLQLVSWRSFDLTPLRTAKMRDELQWIMVANREKAHMSDT